MERIIVVPITCNLQSLDFIWYVAKYISTQAESVSIEKTTAAVLLFNNLEIKTETQDLKIYWDVFKGKLENDKVLDITIQPIKISDVQEHYWSKKVNDMVKQLIPLKEDDSSELAIQGEILLKALNNFFVRAKANNKQVLLFLNQKDPVHRFVKSILDMTRELYLASNKENKECETSCFLPEVRLI